MNRTKIIESWLLADEPPAEHVFLDTMLDDRKYTLEEGTTWDFKLEWPFSYSDSYFGGIARLICAFANTWGGIVVFGVHDSARTGGHIKVTPNFDKLLLALQQLTQTDARLRLAKYGHGTADEVVTIFVYSRGPYAKPLRFTKAIESYQANTIWVRRGHQVVKAEPRDYPVLFCRTRQSFDQITDPEIFGSLPATPTTLKKFVGRAAVLDKLFEWIQTSDEPRTFLYGKGGSGKTSIAYEFARLVRNFGKDLALSHGRHVDTVVFLSAKERSLIVSGPSIETISEPDFVDERSLYEGILLHGGWIRDREKLSELDFNSIRDEIRLFFSISTCVVVLDDIDTLTTKGIEAGFDFLYLTLGRSESGSKVLYTLRNAPSQSLANSIEVPALPRGGEYEAFVSTCVAQFGTTAPSDEFRDRTLAELSERRPLVIESIIALARTAGSYARAAELFQQHVGSDVREYVFLREWDALPSDGLARLLLIAMAEMRGSTKFSDLEAILQVNSSSILDAIGAVREMFLQVDGVGDDATFSLAQLTRQFVNAKKASVPRSDVVRARVKSFRQFVHKASPDIARLTLQVERLLPTRFRERDIEKAKQAWSLVASSGLPAPTTESPIFQSLKGYVASCLRPPRLTDAREAFGFAQSMGYEPDYSYIRAWLEAEGTHPQLDGGLFAATDLVIRGRSYSAIEKAYMRSKKAVGFYFRGRDRLYTEPLDAASDFKESLLLHLISFREYFDSGHSWTDTTYEYAKNTAYNLIDAHFQTPAP